MIVYNKDIRLSKKHLGLSHLIVGKRFRENFKNWVSPFLDGRQEMGIRMFWNKTRQTSSLLL